MDHSGAQGREQLWLEKNIDFGCPTEHTRLIISLDFAVNGDARLYSTTSGCRLRMKSLELYKPVGSKAKLQKTLC